MQRIYISVVDSTWT